MGDARRLTWAGAGRAGRDGPLVTRALNQCSALPCRSGARVLPASPAPSEGTARPVCAQARTARPPAGPQARRPRRMRGVAAAALLAALLLRCGWPQAPHSAHTSGAQQRAPRPPGRLLEGAGAGHYSPRGGSPGWARGAGRAATTSPQPAALRVRLRHPAAALPTSRTPAPPPCSSSSPAPARTPQIAALGSSGGCPCCTGPLHSRQSRPGACLLPARALAPPRVRPLCAAAD